MELAVAGEEKFAALIRALAEHTGVEPRGHGVKRQAICPAHPDRSPSLCIEDGVDRILVFCQAHCPTPEVLAAIGWTMADLFKKPKDRSERPTCVAEYPYRDEKGVLLYTIKRFEPGPDGKKKVFYPYLPGASRAGLGNAKRVPYNLPEVLAAVREGRRVWIPEGEKDCDSLTALGEVATTSQGGAGKWDHAFSDYFHDADVVIIADRDKSGYGHARMVAASLHGKAKSVAVVEASAGKDVTEHVQAGLPLDQLAPVNLADATPEPEPEPAPEREAPAEPDSDEDVARRMLEREIEFEARRLRVREAAAAKVRRERAGLVEMPSLTGLRDFLAVPDPEISYRIDGLFPSGARVMLAAQFKAGKTTLVGNLLRSLADGDDFLGRFTCTPPDGRIVLLDDELDEAMLRRWLREQGVRHLDKVAVVSLRGRVSSFDILDPDIRAQWAAMLRQAGTQFLVLDCLAPVLDALGLSEDKEAGRLLVAFDELLGEAGASEGLMVHHMGHSGERSRGASRLRDWPDVEWRLVREKSDDENALPGESSPDAPRYFSAYGRDVDVPEGRLEFDKFTRRLSLVGGSRKDVKACAVLPDLYDYLLTHPGSSKNKIETADELKANHTKQNIRKALSDVVRSGMVTVAKGAHRADVHTLAPGVDKAQFASSPGLRQRGQDDFASSPIERRTEVDDASDVRPGEVTDGICTVCLSPMADLGDGETTHPNCTPDGRVVPLRRR